MIKYLLAISIFYCFSSCSTMNQEYYKYDSKIFSSFTTIELIVLDYRLANKKDYKKGYGNIYLCKDYRTDKIVRIVSTCTDTKFPKETYVVLYECKGQLNNTILVASDKNWEELYRETPVYFGKVAVPVE